MSKKIYKSTKGITLIALIITIVVLLILVVVAIKAVSGEGILGHANRATTQYSAEQEKEKLQLEVSSYKIAKNTEPETGTLGEWLAEKGYTAEGTTQCTVTMASGRVYNVSETGVTLAEANQGGGGSSPAMQVKHGTGSYADLTSIGAVYYGDMVSIGDEEFYVIGSKSASATKIATAIEINGASTGIAEGHTKLILLARYNLNSSGTAQAVSENYTNNPCAFSSTNYWDPDYELSYPDSNGNYPNLNDETTYPLLKYDGTNDATSEVKRRLTAYSTSIGVTARLMTVEEVVGLGGDNTNDHTTSNCPSFINTQNFWLGSAYHLNYVWDVHGEDGGLVSDYYDSVYGFDDLCGVRPVIEVSVS